MCGIAGFVGKGRIEDIKCMAERLSHRGPDAEGFWHERDKGVYLAHKRLSIIDIEGGSQPMWTPDKMLGIIFNGEIYNHLELRESLEKKGYEFLTDHSDTEVLLWGYKEWGKNICEKLNGMWAFALYDREKKEIFLSRDRFGKKPLFYSFQNGTFAFSSELKSLISHRNISADISARSLKKYFAYGFIPAPHALFEKIFKLPGGHNLVLDATHLTFHIWKYWDFVLEPFEKIPAHPEIEWGEQLRELLAKAVRRRLISDVPLGVFLSGGIDSSSVVAYASRFTEKGRIKTFNIGFKEQSFDESEFSKHTASYFDTDHHSRLFSVDSLRRVIPQLIKKIDEPMGDSSILPAYLLCQETRKHVTVALGGDGADELFAGYDPFHALRLAELYQRIIPKPVHQGIRMIAARLPVSYRNISLDFKIKRTLKGLSYSQNIWNPVWLSPLEPAELRELFQENDDPEDIYSEAVEYWDACQQDTLIDKTLQFYTRMYLQDDILTKIDRAGMLHALEVRSPYLDYELVDFVRKIPAQYKYRNRTTKYILKKSLEKILPNEIIYRSKHGFGIPIGKWFQNGSLDIPAFSSSPLLLNPSFIQSRHKRHVQGKDDDRLFLWNYLFFEIYKEAWHYEKT